MCVAARRDLPVELDRMYYLERQVRMRRRAIRRRMTMVGPDYWQDFKLLCGAVVLLLLCSVSAGVIVWLWELVWNKLK